jgi:hypothetical protein
MSFGAIAASVAGAAVAGGIGAATQKKGGTSSGGYSVQESPQYSWNEGYQKTAADFVNQQIKNMQTSQTGMPAWYDKLAPTIQQGLQTQNQQNYFGTPGNRSGGLVQQAVSGGAGAGLGAGMANRRKWGALQEYGNKSSLIDQFMAQQAMGVMQQQSTQWPALAGSLPQGPGSQNIPYSSSTPGYTSPFSSMANTIAENIPWGNMFSSGSTPAGATNYGGGSWGSSTPYNASGLQGFGNYQQYLQTSPTGGGW